MKAWNCGGGYTLARGTFSQSGECVQLVDSYSGTTLEYRYDGDFLVPLSWPAELNNGEIGGPPCRLHFGSYQNPQPEEKAILAETPVSIDQLRLGMRREEVIARKGRPAQIIHGYWGYGEGLRVRFSPQGTVIGVAGNHLWQQGHQLAVSNLEQTGKLFGDRLQFRDRLHAEAPPFGLTLLFRNGFRDEDCLLGELRLGDIPNPGFTSNY
jgi:hypothetical protein